MTFHIKPEKQSFWQSTPLQKIPTAQVPLYQRIRVLFRTEKWKQALSHIHIFKTKFPKSVLKKELWNIEGLVLLKLHHFKKAILVFQKAIRFSKEEAFQEYVSYNLATTFLEFHQPKQAETTLIHLHPARWPLFFQIKYFYLLARSQETQKKLPQAILSLFQGSFIFPAPTPIKESLEKLKVRYQIFFEALLKDLLKTPPKNLATLDPLFERAQEINPSFLLETFLFYSAQLALQAKKRFISETLFRTLLETYPKTIYFDTASEQLKTLTFSQKTEEKSVGVLLPLSGKYAPFGRKVLNAIELALEIFPSHTQKGVTLFVEDSGSTSESAQKALEKLFYQHHVMAVLGPLLSKYIQPISQKAQDLGIPLLSLSQKAGIKGSFIFYTAITPTQVAETLASFAIEKKHFKRFVILYPNHPYGKMYLNAFWKAITKKGGQFTGVERYDPKQTDFKTQVDKLAGLYDTDARKDELQSLKRLREQYHITHRTRKTEQYYSLPPVVDFDAVFIPDDAKTISLILPTFAYRDIDHVQFLGTPTWGSQTLIRRAPDDTKQIVFANLFSPKAASQKVQSFVQEYQDFFQQTPHSLEAIAFDAAHLLQYALMLSSNHFSRDALAQSLKNIQDFPGVTGKLSYRNGHFFRKLKLFQIRNKNFIEVP